MNDCATCKAVTGPLASVTATDSGAVTTTGALRRICCGRISPGALLSGTGVVVGAGGCGTARMRAGTCADDVLAITTSVHPRLSKTHTADLFMSHFPSARRCATSRDV